MSSLLQKVSDEISAPEPSQQASKRRRPSGKHNYKPHLATKIKWALEDSRDKAEAAQRHMQRLHELYEELYRARFDPPKFAAVLGRMEHELCGLALDVAELERIVTRAVNESKEAKDE